MRPGLPLLAAVSLTAALSLTCSDATGPSVNVTVAGPNTLYLGDSARFVASALNENGIDLNAERRTWRSSNLTVATVDAAGWVRALSLGTADIQATVLGRTGTRQISVVPVPVVSVAVTPATDSLLVGDSLQLTAVGLDHLDRVIPGRAVTWSSPDTAVGTVSAFGLVHAKRLEGFVIHATIDGKIGGAFLRGQEPVAAIGLPDTAEIIRGSSLTFVPELFGATGTPITGRILSWVVDDPTAATVTQQSSVGTVTTARADTTFLIAACCGVADTTVLIIRPRPVSSIAFSLASPLVVGTTRLLEAAVRNDNSQDEVVPVTWRSSDTTILSLTPDPSNSRRVELRGRRAGNAQLHATAGGVSNSTLVRVELPLSRVTIEPDTLYMRVGEQRQVHAVWRDSAGEFRGDAEGTWHSLDTAVVTVHGGTTAIPPVIGRAAGTTTVIEHAVYGGETTTFEDSTVIVVQPAATPRFVWNVAEQFVEAFVPKDITLTLTDSAGNPLPGPEEVTITVADTSVSVSPATLSALNGSTTVAVTGRRAGRITVTARTDSLTASFLLQVVRFGVDSVRFTVPGVMDVGDSAFAGARVFGAGRVLPYPLSWSVSDPGIVSVTAAGTVVGIGPGRVALVARSYEGVDTVVVTVRSVIGPAIDSVAAQPIVAGTAATIPGAGFATNPADNVVLVDGIPAVVTAASASALTIAMPPASSFPCRESRSVLVSVATPAGLAARQLQLITATTITLPAGGAGYVPEGRSTCFELAPTNGFADYNLAIVHANGSAAATTRLTITGRVPGSAALLSQTAEAPAARPSPADLSRVPGLERDRATARLHQTVHAENSRFAASAGQPAPHLRAMIRPLNSVNDSINDRVQIRIPQVYRPDFCVNHTAITARRVFTGQRVVIYEDVNAVLAGQMDGDYAALGAEFDGTMYPLLRANFGNPLALDSLLDNNGRLAMVFSPQVNATGASGFVVTCDFYPESVAPSSNVGEMFYAVVPTSTGTSFGAGTRQEWNWFIRTVVMHEAKHVTAVAERLSRGGPVEEGWLEEGSAVLAEELWSRGIYGTAWKSNAGYNQTIYCDVRPLSCHGKPYSMFNAFGFLYDYADGYTSPPGNEARTPLGSAGGGDASFYGSAWLWLRWIIDQYASSESAFLTALTQDVTRRGVQHFNSLSPEGWPRLIAEWALANQLDDSPIPPPRPEQQHLSWNLRAIFSGMNADFPTFFTRTYPFRMRTAAVGGFVHSFTTLRGGTAAVMRVVGTHTQPQLIEIRDPQGGSPPIQVQVIRLQD